MSPRHTAKADSSMRSQTVGSMADLVSGTPVAPGSGFVATVVVELAAALVARAAMGSPAWDDGEGVATQAQALRRRAAQLTDESARAFTDAVRALSDPPPSGALGDALSIAAAIPLAILDIATAVCELAALTARHGSDEHRPEAIGACAMAEGAAATCAHLVRINLAVLPGDGRVIHADKLALAAAQARSGLPAAG